MKMFASTSTTIINGIRKNSHHLTSMMTGNFSSKKKVNITLLILWRVGRIFVLSVLNIPYFILQVCARTATVAIVGQPTYELSLTKAKFVFLA